MKKIVIFLCVLFVATFSSCGYRDNELEAAEKNSAYGLGYDDGYNEGYEDGYEDCYQDVASELNEIDGYSPVYMSDEIIDALFYLVEEKNGNRYRPEESVEIVYDFFDENSGNMTEEQIEAFLNVITYCYDAEWITRSIVHDMQFTPE